MSISELKIELIKKIIACNDYDVLLKIKSLLSEDYLANLEENLNSVHESNTNYDHLTSEKVRVFSEEEQSKINRALEQYKNGECISDEEAQKEIQEWLNG